MIARADACTGSFSPMIAEAVALRPFQSSGPIKRCPRTEHGSDTSQIDFWLRIEYKSAVAPKPKCIAAL
jgi:hypothetical protein